MNLLKETIEVLLEHGKTEKDVMWCGSPEFGWFTWEDFKEIADVEYDNGYGSQKVATDLLIVGEDFWLERHEYDGSEWWEFKQQPQKPKNYKKPVALTVEQSIEKLDNEYIEWIKLKELNEKIDEY
jgi:hypothetical protein